MAVFRQVASVWPTVLIGAAAVYLLYLYRRARLTEPPLEGRKRGEGFLNELRIWATLDVKRVLGIVGAFLGIGVALLKLTGWSVLALFNLDPFVLANLGTMLASGLTLAGVDLPLFVWVGLVGGLFVLGLGYGTVWKNRHFDT